MINKNAVKGMSEYRIYKKYIDNNNLSEIDERDTSTVAHNNASESAENEMKDNYSAYQELNPEQRKIAEWLEKLKFRKQIIGGISEYDVWKKMIELNAMYEEALNAERIRCDVITDYYKSAISLKEVDKEREGPI